MSPNYFGLPSTTIDSMRRKIKKIVYPTSNKSETVFAFIDAQNINQGTKNSGWQVNWQAFRKWLADEYNVSEAHMYIGYMPKHEDLYMQLNNHGFNINLKQTSSIVSNGSNNSINNNKVANSNIKGNVDVDLTLGVWKKFANFDKAVIISGDGDFSSLIKHLINQGKLKTIIVPELYSHLFNQFNPHLVKLNDYRDKLAYLKKNKDKSDKTNSKNKTAGRVFKTSKRGKVKQILTHKIGQQKNK